MLQKVDSVSSGNEVRIQSGDVTALLAPEYVDNFDTGWFDPDFWQAKATPVSVGGRGSAWFIERPKGDWVLRHYRRGGLVARFNENAYLYTGARGVRSFSEFRLLQQMAEMKLPVPRPVAAGYSRHRLWYQASIIIERLPDVIPWGELLTRQEDCSDTWERVGRVLRSFHDKGVYHADLNCFNILIAPDKVYLIDFDRGELRRAPKVPGEGWQGANLTRLKRSILKIAGHDDRSSLALSEHWARLLAAYCG